MKKLICMIALAGMLFCNACVAAPPKASDIPKPMEAASLVNAEAVAGEIRVAELDAQEAQKTILGYFTDLCGVARASQNTTVISDYLVTWANDAKLTVSKDNASNVIIDADATAGYEDRKKIILQAHMDLNVLSAAPFEPETFVVSAQTDGKTTTAADSNLGASNGIGVAAIMYLLTADIDHGPLRAVFTVDGAHNMTGSAALAADVLDADYLNSFDWLASDSLCYGSAGSRSCSFSRVPTWEAAAGDTSYTISVSGLTGGDSGIYAGMGRANAIRLVAEAVDAIKAAGVTVGIVSFDGSTINEAIPDHASATIVIDGAQAQTLQDAFEAYKQTAAGIYGDTEGDYTFECAQQTEVPAEVLSQEDTGNLLNFLTLSVEGVNTMSTDTDSLVESSETLSSVLVEHDVITIKKYLRSYSSGRFDQMENADSTLANMCGFSVSRDVSIPGWSADAASELLQTCLQVYHAIHEEDMAYTPTHTNLECGFFSETKPELQMIAIGAQIDGLHSRSETLQNDSVAALAQLAASLLISME